MKIVQILINAPDINVNINSFYEHGLTSFHEACKQELFHIVEFLIQDPRLNINTSNKYGYIPFQEVCLKRNIYIIKIFLSEGLILENNFMIVHQKI